MEKPLKQPKVHRCRCDKSFPSRYLDASGPHGMMWRRTFLPRFLLKHCEFVPNRLDTISSTRNVGIQDICKCTTLCLSIKKRGWSKYNHCVFGDVSKGLSASRTSPSSILFCWETWMPQSRIKNKHAIQNSQIHFK